MRTSPGSTTTPPSGRRRRRTRSAASSPSPGDATMTPAFRDSPLWGPLTNQVGHLLCAVETGARVGRLEKHPFERRAFDLGLAAANRLMGLDDVKGDARDWSRAGMIG